ncbi:hypothetical protein BU26DRAFT_282590 [Trematosphaeria pertusa]|uniref:Uncharacterized protein n=1 Tax=Trematosphaeria pertusa TaxID=390896 RepID=A0A6A6IMU3_9PLEO|nr:uncharacterized protein BU26DRAFT_282590 [Trematosphaeria pertusa]KAF2251418.1 hypothetical protein BU26DRAFT_282590 [Trematosphaeria pertusa]
MLPKYGGEGTLRHGRAHALPCPSPEPQFHATTVDPLLSNAWAESSLRCFRSVIYFPSRPILQPACCRKARIPSRIKLECSANGPAPECCGRLLGCRANHAISSGKERLSAPVQACSAPDPWQIHLESVLSELVMTHRLVYSFTNQGFVLCTLSDRFRLYMRVRDAEVNMNPRSVVALHLDHSQYPRACYEESECRVRPLSERGKAQV